jgi:hypothetical protein
MFKKIIKKLLQSIPVVGVYFKVNDPPGHFYSPIVSSKYIIEKENFIFSNKTKKIIQVEMNEEYQLDLLEKVKVFYNSIPFNENKKDGLRYYFENQYYSYSDAIFLHLFLRFFKPKKLIEVGSGFSSAVTLDTNDLFFNNQIKCTFIEPNPQRLYSILKENEKQSTEIFVKEVQEIPLAKFSELDENDILFIDSSHISKAGSDLNYILFDILPSLKKGVIIHFHDIYFPFEYPKEMLINDDGFGSNEAYLLRAFLMYNNSFEIISFNTFLQQFHRNWFEQNMPLCLKNLGGSIWLRKIN